MSGCVQVEPQLKQSYGGPGGHVFHVLAKPHKTAIKLRLRLGTPLHTIPQHLSIVKMSKCSSCQDDTL